MESANEFNLEAALAQWEKSNFSQADLTLADKEEFKNHILNTIEELKEKGLSDEEAFIVVQMRFGEKKNRVAKKNVNNKDNFQLKKLIILFSGVFAYIFSFYFILCLHKILILFLNLLNGNKHANYETIKPYFHIIYLITIFTIVAFYFMHKPVVLFFKRLKISPIQVNLFVGIMIFTVLFNWYLALQVKKSLDDIFLLNAFFYSERNFKYLFLLITGIGYIILFYRYRKKFYIKY